MAEDKWIARSRRSSARATTCACRSSPRCWPDRRRRRRYPRFDDATIAAAIVAGNYGGQRISSHHDQRVAGRTPPLSRVFMLMGQRYVLDSHVFSNVVFDRVQGGQSLRMMPDPLDVAFAALETTTLCRCCARSWNSTVTRPISRRCGAADDHGETFWGANLYNCGWRRCALSNVAAGQTVPLEIAGPRRGGRTLNTQLASWAELRHDTILYVKSHGGVVRVPGSRSSRASSCSRGSPPTPPCAGRDVAVPAGSTLADSVVQHFDQLAAVRYVEGDGGVPGAGRASPRRTWRCQRDRQGPADLWRRSSSGWYSVVLQHNPTEFAPTIADVHHAATDEAQSRRPGVARGDRLRPPDGADREHRTGPRVYVGPVSSEYEENPDFQRSTTRPGSRPVPSSPADALMSSLIVEASARGRRKRPFVTGSPSQPRR